MVSKQREGLLRVMLLELAEKGYPDLSTAAVLTAVGVSEEEFEREFGDKDRCLSIAYEELVDRLIARMTAACDAGDAWPERVRSGLAALLDELAADPPMARVLTRSYPGIRPATYQRYVDLLARLVPFLEEGREYSGLEEALPAEVELLAVGAAEAIVFNEVDSGRVARLPKLMPEILFSILVPFIGPDRASEEMRSAAAAL